MRRNAGWCDGRLVFQGARGNSGRVSGGRWPELMPRISVVIPLFAQGAYIERAVRSVLAQGHADLEIIVVDDGSPDDGASRLERCQDARLRLLRQSHGGVSRARNSGIRAATGDWLAFLDADDEWLPDFIGEMLDAVRRHPEVNAVFANYRSATAPKAWLRGVENSAETHVVADYFDFLRTNRGLGMLTSATLVRRSTLLALEGFPPDVEVGQDTDTWCRLAWSGPVAFQPRVLSVYHAETPDSATKRAMTGKLAYPAVAASFQRWQALGRIPARLLPGSLWFIEWTMARHLRELLNRGFRDEARRLLETDALSRGVARRSPAVRLRLLIPPRFLPRLVRAFRRVVRPAFGVEAADTLLLGLDIDDSSLRPRLPEHLQSAPVVSLQSNELAGGAMSLPPNLRALMKKLRQARCGALVVLQNVPRLILLAALVPARTKSLLAGDGTLRPLGLGATTVHVLREILVRHLPGFGRAVEKPPPRAGNDYSFIVERASDREAEAPALRASIVIPVYNRRESLARTLAGLEGQDYPPHLTEVIVVDDGSHDAPETVVELFRGRLDVRIIAQPDLGYRLAAARNLGIRAATGDVILSLDCDMLPDPGWLSAHMKWHRAHSGSLCVIGYREFIDATDLTVAQIRDGFDSVRRLPKVEAPAAIRDRASPRRDWRIGIIERSGGLRRHRRPYMLASGGNLSFRREEALRAGLFDEAFNRWGGEDSEFAYRLYRRGAYFVPEPSALAYHQDHPESAPREADRVFTTRLLHERVPALRPAGLSREGDRPRVSVYKPAFNASETITRAVSSVLAQPLPDLEICIVDDGSNDDTVGVLERHYGKDPRVRWTCLPHQGIAAASRAALEMTRGEFGLQLDADDEILKDAIEVLLALMDDDTVSLAYAGFEEVSVEGVVTRSVRGARYDPQRHLAGQIVSPPRLFRSRDYHRSQGFDVTLPLAVDYDLCLKLAEQGRVVSSPRILYRRHLHAANASLMDLSATRACQQRAVEAALRRRNPGGRQATATSAP